MNTLIKLFARDLNRLYEEVSAFDNQDNLWKKPRGISNSAGNLTLHLIGNLNHFIGATIGETGYIRDRDGEFNRSDFDKRSLLKMIEETRETVIAGLSTFDIKKLSEPYPIQVFGEEMTNEFFLIHLVSHLNYHLGQINYLRRILEN